MSDKESSSGDSQVITEADAAELIGKHILVGLTYMDADQKPMSQTQLHGVVVRANPREGIVLRQSDGSEYALPPTREGFEEGQKASYRLRSKGEVVEDPDYVVSYIVNQHQ